MQSNVCFLRLAVFSFVLCAAASLSAQERLEWQPVEGAHHYMVLIRQDGELVIETSSTDPWLPLFVPPGDYELKIKAFNTFGNVFSESGWSVLHVLPADPGPFIAGFSPTEVVHGHLDPFTVQVFGYFPEKEGSESSLFYLVNSEDRKIPFLPADEDLSGKSDEFIDIREERELELVFSGDLPEPGEWTLVMENPDGRIYKIENAITVTEAIPFKIKKIWLSHEPGPENEILLNMSVTGLEDGAEVLVEGSSVIPASIISRTDSEVVQCLLDISGVEYGWYNVTVRNPSGKSHCWENAFEIPRLEKRPMNPKDVEEMPLPKYFHSASLGFIPGFIIGKEEAGRGSLYSTMTAAYNQSFLNTFIRRKYWLSGLSWNITLGISAYLGGLESRDLLLSYPSFRTGVLLGLDYVTPFKSFINLRFQAGSGVVYSHFEDFDESFDWQMYGSGGLRFDFTPRVYVDILCGALCTFYSDGFLLILEPKLEGGWRW